MNPRNPGQSGSTASFLAMAALVFTCLFIPPAHVAAQSCSGFPWTVTATPTGGLNVSVHVCGTYVGCQPHNPTVNFVGNVIAVVLTQSELPDCICVQPQSNFGLNVPLAAPAGGNYEVIVYDLNCGTSIPAGQTTVSVAAGSVPVPVLDARGAAVLALLIVAAGIWKLRP